MPRRQVALLILVFGLLACLQPVIASAEQIHLSCDVKLRSSSGALPENSGGSFGLTLDMNQRIIEGDLYSFVSTALGVPFKNSANRISTISDKQIISDFYWTSENGRQQVLTTVVDRYTGDLVMISSDKLIQTGTKASFFLEGACSKPKKLF